MRFNWNEISRAGSTSPTFGRLTTHAFGIPLKRSLERDWISNNKASVVGNQISSSCAATEMKFEMELNRAFKLETVDETFVVAGPAPAPQGIKIVRLKSCVCVCATNTITLAVMNEPGWWSAQRLTDSGFRLLATVNISAQRSSSHSPHLHLLLVPLR